MEYSIQVLNGLISQKKLPQRHLLQQPQRIPKLMLHRQMLQQNHLHNTIIITIIGKEILETRRLMKEFGALPQMTRMSYQPPTQSKR